MTRRRTNPGIEGATPRSLLGRAGSAPARRSFTLIEVLIVVGAVALIGVALAAVFEHTGRTVTVGRRVSALNSYASLLEAQMRRDFSRISRDGFLIIRNEYADANRIPGFQFNPPPGANTPGVEDVVALHADDLRPRPRRIDELMLFVEGDFTSVRDPVDPQHIARSSAARVYYGHGKRRRSDAGSSPLGSPYLVPSLDDPNDEAEANLGVVPPPGVTNPNRYAADWILLRHVTVLAPPRTTPEWSTMGPASRADRDIQVALQPAARDVFRALAAMSLPQGDFLPLPSYPPQYPSPGALRDSTWPQFSSGIVDIATTTLGEIRQVVLSADTWPGQVPTGASGQAAGQNFYDPGSNTGPDGSNAGPDGKFRFLAAAPQGDPDVLWRMQSWMADALPAWSSAPDPDNRTRLRCEATPPNFLGVLDPNSPYYSGNPDIRSLMRSDQLMLSASNFIPHCTEFIVEWSFGVTYPSDPQDPNYRAGREGELIWHGMTRLADGRPAIPAPTSQTQMENDPDLVAQPYNPLTADVQRHTTRYRRIDGSIGQHPVTASDFLRQLELIHGAGIVDPYAPPPGDPVTSYFGYIDPTFNPDRDGDGVVQGPTDATGPLEWVWPRLIRVTVGLADPNDPTVEQRFQFVFEIPPGREP